jgi:hypothetical protein
MNVVLVLHSIVRWIIVLIGLVSFVRSLLVLTGRAPGSKMDRGLMSGFTGLLDLNVLLGLIVIVGLGEWEPQQIEHAVTNVIAVVVAHIFAQRAKKIEDTKLKARMNALGVLISLLIIVLGVSFINGWAR